MAGARWWRTGAQWGRWIASHFCVLSLISWADGWATRMGRMLLRSCRGMRCAVFPMDDHTVDFRWLTPAALSFGAPFGRLVARFADALCARRAGSFRVAMIAVDSRCWLTDVGEKTVNSQSWLMIIMVDSRCWWMDVGDKDGQFPMLADGCRRDKDGCFPMLVVVRRQ